MEKKIIKIDSSKGGNGDVWMRLVSFYASAALLPDYSFSIIVPEIFKTLSILVFGDRLNILTDSTTSKDMLVYTNLGIKDLIKPILNGRRFISPYQRAVIQDKKKKEIKDFLNILLFKIVGTFGFVLVPDKKWIPYYQGYLDIVSIKAIEGIEYTNFEKQLKLDFVQLLERLNSKIPISPELHAPSDLCDSVLVFPTGTSRQFIPLWWASNNLKNAYFAFYFKDDEAKEFLKTGLKVIYFYKEPGDIIFLSQKAKWTVSTDSFPSHLLQYSNPRTTIVLTEVLKTRIISPVFSGVVVDSVAPCHPCLHKAKKIHPLCDAGLKECLNWKSKVYTENILKSIK